MFPYAAQDPFPGDLTLHYFYDAPDAQLDNLDGIKQVTETFAAHTYLMFRPSGDDTIWVPIESRNWNFAGAADKIGGDDDITSWSLVGNPTPVKLGPWKNSSAEPVWSKVVVNGVGSFKYLK